MVVKKYFGKTARDALQQVREELGADALILSNRPTVSGGVEMMAVADADVANLASSWTRSSSSRHPPRNTHSPSTTSPIDQALARTYALPVEPHFPPSAAVQARKPGIEPKMPPPIKPVETALPGQTHAMPQINHELKEIGDEMKSLRGLLQSQLANFAWSDMQSHSPQRLELFKNLLSSGLSAALIRQLVDKLPLQYRDDIALKWARSALLHNLYCLNIETDLLDKGGVYALVGPTGVGKTTTVAKLAAKATMKFGPQHVALITTDRYRIGAQDQLQIYGKILGVPVLAMQNADHLQQALADLSKYHIIFVDTVGMSQRDQRLPAQLAMLSGQGRSITRLLVMAATSDGRTLEDVVRYYQARALEGCILSKIDESVLLGPSLDIIIRHRLKLFCVTNGQRVPEDLHLAHGPFLVDRALKVLRNASSFLLDATEFPILNAAQAGWV